MEFLHANDPNAIYCKKNEIHFSTRVTDLTINALIRTFDKCLEEHKKEPKITFYIDSPGGSVSDCFKFVDYIDMLRKDGKIKELTTIITGCAASAATIMAIVGDRRLMTKSAVSMIHESSGMVAGELSKIGVRVAMMRGYQKRISELYAMQTGKKEEEIDAAMQRETWYSAKEYLDAGFIHEIC